MDCGGHGSHVAGTVGGSGVRSDGTPFPGPYDGNVPFSSLRIGPGVAPKASLYALRVFGCSGSTGLVTQALEWAIDPNKDGDFSDHLDVVNMSLGSEFGDEHRLERGRLRQRRPGRRRRRLLGGEQRRHLLRHRKPRDLGLRDLRRGLGRLRDHGRRRSGSSQPSSVAGVVERRDGRLRGHAARERNDRAPRLRRPRRTPARRSRTASALAGEGRAHRPRDVPLRREGQARAGRGRHRRRRSPTTSRGRSAWAATDATVTIPSVLISLSDGNRLKAELAGGVVVALFPGSDTLASFSSRGPRRESVPAGPKPDIAGPGASITSVASGVTLLLDHGRPVHAAGARRRRCRGRRWPRRTSRA